MIAKSILYMGKPVIVACDADCVHAWGIHSRPRVQLSDNPDDYEFLADYELEDAPIDPGTYEGNDAKPRTPAQRLNRWCVRECERCVWMRPDKEGIQESRDFSRRLRNIP